MEIKWHNRIHIQISTILLVLTTLSLAVFCWYAYSSTRTVMYDEMDRFTRTATERLASYLGGPVANSDRKQIETIILAELKDERVDSIIFKNIDQSVFLAWEKKPDGTIIESRASSNRGTPSGIERIIYENKVLGSIELFVLPNFMSSPLIQSVTNLSLLSVGLNLGILLALYLVLRKILVNPMRELTTAAENISLGRLEGAIVNYSKNELGQLTTAIERLRVSMRIAIKRFASTQKVSTGIDAEEWKNVILEKKNYGFEFLALRILAGRLIVDYRNNPTPETMRQCVHQLVDFFQNEKNPLAQKDLNKIFGGVVL